MSTDASAPQNSSEEAPSQEAPSQEAPSQEAPSQESPSQEAPIVRLATCSCGQLQAKATGDPVRVSVCHCYACQKRTGSTYGVQAAFPEEAVEVSGRASEWVRVGDEGTSCRFYFCPDCGAIAYYRPQHMPRIVIPVGAFADNTFPAPTFSVYEERKHPWVSVPEDAEHWW